MLLYVLTASYLLLNLYTFFTYGNDKRKAKKKRFRTPEAKLLCLGFFGGSVGALLGMNLFRHKTKHWYFWAINFLGIAWQIALLIFIKTHI